MTNREGCEESSPVSILGYCPSIFLEETRKTTKYHSQDSRFQAKNRMKDLFSMMQEC
jgi:hypothetical protein